MKKGMGIILGVGIIAIMVISMSPDYGNSSPLHQMTNKWALICVSTNNLSSYPDSDAFPAQGLQAYYILKKHGYMDDNIIFMLWNDNNTNVSIYGNHNDLLGPPPQIGGIDEPPEIDYDQNTPLPAGVNNWYELLQYNINWLASHVGPNDDVVIYLVNHGNYNTSTGKGEFFFEDNSGPLSESTFDSWVDNISCEKMTILIDACYSGDFIDAPVDPGFDSGIDDENNRILISSTGNCSGWFYITATGGNWAGSIFFHPFFKAINEGKSVKEAYNYACSYMIPEESENVSELQNPQLVDRTGESAAYSFLEPLYVWVDDDFDNSTPGWDSTHFNNIQQAIDSVAYNGTVYVYKGTYNESIVIDKPLTIEGNGTVKLFSKGNGISVKADDVKLINLTIDAKNNGISLQNVNNVNITQCNVLNSSFGIYSVNSMNCSIWHTSIHKNEKGIYLFNSSRFFI
ncbi:MAG: hypothetical protein J7J36_00990, partial [Thermoplasmata archaeon]|nr:hypothetical protein [Thermoplasmata archaeon]